jgi:hypothetical protein
MSQQIIKQPNGNYALFSSVVDDFIVLDCTPDDVVAEFVKDFRRSAERAIRDKIAALDRGEKPYHQFTMSWEQAIRCVREIHGDETESLRMIAALEQLAKRPPAKRKRRAETVVIDANKAVEIKAPE